MGLTPLALTLVTLALFGATVAVAVVARRGLKSIALSKSDMQNRLTRETVQCAIDHCNEMSRELLPALTELFGALASKGIPLFHEQRQRAIRLMNRLECWSMCFTHNPALADESVAFEPCSTVFCQMVMCLYPALLTQRRTNPASGPFQNVVTLFNGWYSKQAQGAVLEQLKRLQSEDVKLPPHMATSL